MKQIIALMALLLAPLSALLVADPGSDQGKVREQHKAGDVRSLREIEREVLPRMKGMQYLGPEYDPAAMAYRLKFISKGKVYFVDVDARSGKVISRSN